jgi:integrase
MPAPLFKQSYVDASRFSTERPLSSLLEAYIRTRDPKLSDKSKSTYRETIKRYSKWLEHPAKVKDLCDRSIRKAFTKMDEAKVARSSIVMLYKLLKSLWEPLYLNRIVTSEIRLRCPRIPRTNPIAWTEEQEARLFRAIRNTKGFMGNIPLCNWWEALACLLFDTAERIGAVTRAQWQDLKEDGPENLTITFRHNTRKGGMEDSVVPLHRETFDLLLNIKPENATPEDMIFRHPWTSLCGKLTAIIKRAGLPDDRWHKFHCFRRTAATRFAMYSKSQDPIKAVADLLGHANVHTTITHYLDKTQILSEAEHPCDVVPRQPTAPKKTADEAGDWKKRKGIPDKVPKWAIDLHNAKPEGK